MQVEVGSSIWCTRTELGGGRRFGLSSVGTFAARIRSLYRYMPGRMLRGCTCENFGALPGAEEQAEEAARVLDEAGAEVLLDDRNARAGEKFADADLVGLPIRITVGKKTLEDGAVDVRDRASGEERRVSIAELGSIL
jgi:histidyl-tRNA synthetase